MATEIKPKTIKIARTKNGSPSLWESFVEFDNMKRATIIVDKNGIIKNSIFVKKGSKQSLVPVKENDYIIKVFNDDTGRSISILKINEILKMSNHAKVTLVYRSTPTDSSDIRDSKFDDAINAAFKKLDDPTFVVSELIQNEIQ